MDCQQVETWSLLYGISHGNFISLVKTALICCVWTVTKPKYSSDPQQDTGMQWRAHGQNQVRQTCLLRWAKNVFLVGTKCLEIPLVTIFENQ